MSRPSLWWPCAVFAASLGCSDGGSTPTAPTPAPPTPPSGPPVSSLRVDATSIGVGTRAAIVAGQSHQMRVQGRTPDGLIDVEAAWHSDNPSVLTTTPRGRITGVANGAATIVAVYQGISSAMNVRVATDYGGGWPGTLRLISCESPDASFCGQSFPPGTVRPLRLSIVMDRAFAVVRFTWDDAGTTLVLGETVEVGLDGALVFAGAAHDSRGLEAPLLVAGWRAELAAPDRMTGRVSLIHGLRDPARTVWELIDVTRAR